MIIDPIKNRSKSDFDKGLIASVHDAEYGEEFGSEIEIE